MLVVVVVVVTEVSDKEILTCVSVLVSVRVVRVKELMTLVLETVLKTVEKSVKNRVVLDVIVPTKEVEVRVVVSLISTKE